MSHTDLPTPLAAEQKLALADLQPFGIGGRRLCFVHPLDKLRCVKVLRQDAQRTVRLAKKRILPAWAHPQYDNNRHEQRILEALYRQIGPDMQRHLPISYGRVDTDLGAGLELDLIRDADGAISRSIRELITLGVDLQTLKPAWEQLGEFLLRHVVLSRNLLDHNIVARQDAQGAYSLAIIDGLGDPAWLPFGRWFRTLGRAKVRKRLDQAWPRFERFAREGGVTQEMRTNSTWGQGMLNHRD